MPPALKETVFECSLEWMGVCRDDEDGSLRSESISSTEVSFDGMLGEVRHAGSFRDSDVRVINMHSRGTKIRNVRQITILSTEELALIEAEMKISEKGASLDPGWIGASLLVSGIPNLTHLPPSSRLQSPSGLTLVVDMENRPCIYPGKVIEEHISGHGGAFKKAAEGRRGITAWVERPGNLKVGDTFRLFIPDQPAWAHHPTYPPNAETTLLDGVSKRDRAVCFLAGMLSSFLLISLLNKHS